MPRAAPDGRDHFTRRALAAAFDGRVDAASLSILRAIGGVK